MIQEEILSYFSLSNFLKISMIGGLTYLGYRSYPHFKKIYDCFFGNLNKKIKEELKQITDIGKETKQDLDNSLSYQQESKVIFSNIEKQIENIEKLASGEITNNSQEREHTSIRQSWETIEQSRQLRARFNNYIKKKSQQRLNRQSARSDEISCFINKLKERIQNLEDIVSDKNKTINTTYELFYNSVMQDI